MAREERHPVPALCGCAAVVELAGSEEGCVEGGSVLGNQGGGVGERLSVLCCVLADGSPLLLYIRVIAVNACFGVVAEKVV